MKAMTIAVFAETVGVSACTLRICDRKGILVALRTPTGQRRYSEQMIDEVLRCRSSETSIDNQYQKTDY